MTSSQTSPKLTPRMVEALLAAAEDRNQKNRHPTYIALEKRGLVEYRWIKDARCWYITPAGTALAAAIRKGRAA